MSAASVAATGIQIVQRKDGCTYSTVPLTKHSLDLYELVADVSSKAGVLHVYSKRRKEDDDFNVVDGPLPAQLHGVLAHECILLTRSNGTNLTLGGMGRVLNGWLDEIPPPSTKSRARAPRTKKAPPRKEEESDGDEAENDNIESDTENEDVEYAEESEESDENSEGDDSDDEDYHEESDV